jgi:hypothetical protein
MFWLALNCALVCRWVEYGVHFVSQADNPNHASALRNADFVDNAAAERCL